MSLWYITPLNSLTHTSRTLHARVFNYKNLHFLSHAILARVIRLVGNCCFFKSYFAHTTCATRAFVYIFIPRIFYHFFLQSLTLLWLFEASVNLSFYTFCQLGNSVVYEWSRFKYRLLNSLEPRSRVCWIHFFNDRTELCVLGTRWGFAALRKLQYYSPNVSTTSIDIS